MKKSITIIMIILLMVSTSASLISYDTIETNATQLVIITKNDSTMYQRYVDAFAASSLGASVGITSSDQISVYNPTTYDGFLRSLTDERIGGSIAWGGSEDLYNQLILDGAISPITDTVLLDWITDNVSDTISGIPMKGYDASGDLRWTGYSVTSFGFTVNNDTLQNRGLQFPTTFADLASSEFYTSITEFNVAMANSPDSTSISRIYELIIDKFGWKNGWQLIYQMAGNAKIYGGSVETLAAVVTGTAVAALTIDFLGFSAMQDNSNTQYVIPDDVSSLEPNPIAISSTAPDTEQAKAFLKFVLSEEGQGLMLDNRINRIPINPNGFDVARTYVSTDPYMETTTINMIENIYNKTLKKSFVKPNQTDIHFWSDAASYMFDSTITNVHIITREIWTNMVNDYSNGIFTPTFWNGIRAIYGDVPMSKTDVIAINSELIEDADLRLQYQSDWKLFAESKLTEVDNRINANFIINHNQTKIIDPDSSTDVKLSWIGILNTNINVTIFDPDLNQIEMKEYTDDFIHNLTILADQIEIGDIYRLKVTTALHNENYDITLAISENNAPTIQFEFDQVNRNLKWNISDQSSGTYNLFKNNSIVSSGDWVPHQDYLYSIPNSDQGYFQFKLEVLDSNDNSALAFVNVTIESLSDTDAPSLTASVDKEARELTFSAIDDAPDYFVFSVNGNVDLTDSWSNNNEYTIEFADDLYGDVHLAIEVYDVYNNSVSKTFELFYELPKGQNQNDLDDNSNQLQLNFYSLFILVGLVTITFYRKISKF